MTVKIKVLSFALFALVAMSAAAITEAGAKTGGHFDVGSEHTFTTAMEGEGHEIELAITGLENGIVCDEVSYEGTTAGKSVTQIDVSPEYAGCHTTGAEPGTTSIDTNECTYRFTVSPRPAEEHNTVDLRCPESSPGIQITHPQCTIVVPPIEGLSGIVYNNIEESGVWSITSSITLSGFEMRFEEGICIFLGTKHVGELNGAVTVTGFDTDEEQVDLTAVATEPDPCE